MSTTVIALGCGIPLGCTPVAGAAATAGCRHRPLLPRGHPLGRRRPHHRGGGRHARDDVQAVRRQGGSRPRLPRTARTSSCAALFAQAAGESSDPLVLLDLVIARHRGTTSASATRAAAPSSTRRPSTPTTARCATLIADHREWFRATLEQLAAAAGLTEPDDVAASLVLLRDAALVGGYLDGARPGRSGVRAHGARRDRGSPSPDQPRDSVVPHRPHQSHQNPTRRADYVKRRRNPRNSAECRVYSGRSIRPAGGR